MDRPAYFELARCRASARWDQLESDPDLAGPWHQLFKQVQSPRHVLSELLQNADDAGATEASVDVEGEEFIFSHNGEDFIEENFVSLCRFGYSNKRALHTIGFRGVGFKSTFSLGDQVRLFTPTLSVAFNRSRFTEPHWVEDGGLDTFRTVVRVSIKDGHRKLELEKNLEEWFKSPASLLFFRRIRSLRIKNREVRWVPQGEGPVEDSEWMTLSTEPDKPYLLVRSPEEEFPVDALQEIRQERMLSVEEDVRLPPCRVETVLGFDGRLFVILPTGVKTELPFACNAPFVQDPARVKIKDPETSPTNRWLLGRLGELAAKTMVAWLNRADLTAEKRCDAYRLFPDVDREDNTLEGSCAAHVEKAFDDVITDERFLLTEDGELAGWGKCFSINETVLDIWTAEQARTLFVEGGSALLSRHVAGEHLKKLIHWGCVEALDKSKILDSLESNHLPRPARWKQLLTLWDYVSIDVTGYQYQQRRKGLRIFPVRGREVLYAANEVVRLGEGQLLNSQEDWEFLSQYLLVIDQNWTRFLTTQRREAEEAGDHQTGKQVAAAVNVLAVLGHNDASDVSVMIQRVAHAFFSQKELNAEDCFRLAQLAATLGATVPEDFHFVTQDNRLRPVSQHLMIDLNHDLDTFIDKAWYEQNVIHDGYGSAFTSCTEAEWDSWITSGRSRLLTFLPLLQTQDEVWGRPKLEGILAGRGVKEEINYPYRKSRFVIEDWDFNSRHWRHWNSLAQGDDSFWQRVLERILKQPKDYWSKATLARALQVATSGTRRAVTQEPLLPSWIMKFRELPCLRDTWGTCHQPAELLRRTPETESLLDVEPFIRAELDTEANRPLLIKLGVRDTPTGPERLLERLGTLANLENPPVHEVEKWYHRLDGMIVKCSTEEFETVKRTFQADRVILTEDKVWARTAEVFIERDEEDVPDAAVVLPSVRHLTLWHRIGVADRPTADLAIEWLKTLPSGRALTQDEVRRVRALLPKHSDRIWAECGHWLNLDGEWTPVTNLSYALTMQTLVPWKHLFAETKQKTADFQKLSSEVCQRHPFSTLPVLADNIEEHFQENLFGMPPPRRVPWLGTLGTALRRIELDDEEETIRVRALAQRLARTDWQASTGLETVPYIGGVPAGAARRIDVLWMDTTLYVEDRSAAKMAKAVAQEIGRVFGKAELIDAVKLCYDREQNFITEYLEENFRLAPLETFIESEAKDSVSETSSQIGADRQEEPPADTDQIIDEEENSKVPESVVEVGDATGQEFGGEHAGEEILDEEGEPAIARRKHAKPTKVSLIERFARTRGYSVDGADRFYHADAGWIGKGSGNSFWELHSASGELVKSYWVKEHCIRQDPLQLDADVWGLFQKFPDRYSLILSDVDGNPVEISGQNLRAMHDRGELTLYPATYRLVYQST